MNAYDQVSYINSPYAQTHPSRLYVMGRMAGLQPAAVEQSRVLEIGASEGENLIGMAMVLPSAEFIGIELAEVPVERGNRTIRGLGLTNVRLERMNVLDVDETWGRFDYIIAHGLYAWTPMVVRDGILAVAGAHLNAQGVAFISYNTYPGTHIRKIQREMMLYHIGDEQSPARRLEKARELLRVMAMGRPEMDAGEAAMAAQAIETLGRTDSALFHDDLCDIYEPVYFHEFAAHAARHGLQYMGEANRQDSLALNLAPEAIRAAREMAGGDRIAEQQYLDFARTRRFRQTLLCPAGNRLSDGSVEGCYAGSSAQETEEGVFTNGSGVRLTTKHPAATGYLRRLISWWPRLEQVSAEDAQLASELFGVGMIELHGFPGAGRRAGEMPCASALARYQAARGDGRVTTLGHRSLELADEAARKLIARMDGSRTREQLALEMECSRESLEGALSGLERHEMVVG